MFPNVGLCSWFVWGFITTQTIFTGPRSRNSRRPCSNPSNPRFRQALVGEMNKIPKPFIVVIEGTVEQTHRPQKKKNKAIIQPS